MLRAFHVVLIHGATGVLTAAAIHYTVTVIPAPQGFTNVTLVTVNSAGQILGNGTNSSGLQQPFIISGSTTSAIPLPGSGKSGTGAAINNFGQVAVNYEGPFIGTTSGSTAVPLGANFTSAYAYAINNIGQIAGSYNTPSLVPPRPFIGTTVASAGLCCLFGGVALAINDSGQVCGYTIDFINSGLAFTGKGSGLTYIPEPSSWGSSPYLAGSATAINNSGQVAGWGYATGATQAFIGTAAGTTAIPLLLGASVTTDGVALNDADIVVGTATSGAGWIWDGQTTRALTDLVPAGWTISSAKAINNAGVILATGSFQGGGVQNLLLTPGVEFVPVTPCRVMDTRNATGTFGGPFLAGGGTRTVPVQSGSCNIPSNASAYSVNVTVVPRKLSLGYLTAWPAGQTQPVVSTLNSPDGSVVSNAAIVSAGLNGAINFFATDDTELVLDINGYFTNPASNTLAFYPLAPCRILDTRQANGPFGGPFIAGNTSRSFPIPNSSCGAGFARAYSLNVTVVPRSPLGYLTVWPSDQARPLASALNSPDGSVRAVAAIVPSSASDGSVSFFATNDTDLIVDINGYFDLPGHGPKPMDFYQVAPCRVADTRGANGLLSGPIIAARTSRTFPIASSPCGLPSDAGAYSLNMTVVPSGFLGYLSVWNTGAGQPVVSTLNGYKGIVAANAAIVPDGLNGSIDAYVTDTTQLVIDVNGYFR